MKNFETVILLKLGETVLHNTYSGTWNFKAVHAYLDERTAPLILFADIVAVADLPIMPQSTLQLADFTCILKFNHNSNRFCSLNFYGFQPSPPRKV